MPLPHNQTDGALAVSESTCLRHPNPQHGAPWSPRGPSELTSQGMSWLHVLPDPDFRTSRRPHVPARTYLPKRAAENLLRMLLRTGKECIEETPSLSGHLLVTSHGAWSQRVTNTSPLAEAR